MKTKLTIALLALALPSFAAEITTPVTLEWDPSPSSNVTEYIIYQGESPGVYTTQYNAGLATTYIVPDLHPGITYYFTATAKDSAELESLPSNELVYTVPTGTPVTAIAPAEFNRNAVRTLIQWPPNPADQLVFLYEVKYRKQSDLESTLISTALPNTQIPTDLASTYIVSIRAIGPDGPGPWTDRILPGLVPPASLYLSPANKIQYTWKP